MADLSRPPEPERLLDTMRVEVDLQFPRSLTDAQVVALVYGALNGTRKLIAKSVTIIPPRMTHR